MTDLHKHYDQLTAGERSFVDDMFSNIFRWAKYYDVVLNGNDDAEGAVDALARLVLVSRKEVNAQT